MMRVIQRMSSAKPSGKIGKLEQNIAAAVFVQCFSLKPKESVVVIVDKKKLQIARILFAAATNYASDLKMLVFDGMTENGQEPCTEVAEAMIAADVAVLVTDFSLSHTKARVKASDSGTRIASLPGITLAMMKRTMNVNYAAIKKSSEELAQALTKANLVKISAAGGTDLNISLKGRAGEADTGDLTQNGAFGNLPAGEAFIAPLEGTANGVLVVDGSLADIQLDRPVTITIKNGFAVKITGGSAAKELEKAMNLLGKKARVVAEFGIGTNPAAIVQPDVLEAEKAAGTIHIAFGYNADFGGLNEVEFHTDGVVLRPTFILE
ncbi:MAG TPA: aminopeptidase [Candidatus Saccharimonadia bacterium]|nr:aminopeptidase [Candidatus Saccharimonadia bacterium]